MQLQRADASDRQAGPTATPDGTRVSMETDR